MKEALKFSVAGVRGVVGDSFTPQIAASFAQAFGTFVGRGAVVIGRDSRPSGLMIEHAVVAGLQSVGCKVIRTGIVPTPTLLFLTRHLRARGGIAITASHNPASWNALKFIEPTGVFLSEIRAEELFDIYHQQDFPLVPEADIRWNAEEKYPVEAHFKKVVDYVDREAIRKRRFKVAVDCCNGVGAVHSPLFLRSLLGCDVVPIFDTPSGVFEREPEPLPKHLGALRQAVVHHKCDVGFAQDPDGDRLAIVDERGEPLGEDFTLALAMQQVLDGHGRGPVAMSLSTSKAVEHVAAVRGCKAVRTKIGEINVTETMLQIGAVVGGESTGGVIVPAIHPCRDSYAAMAIVLELLAATGKTPSAIKAAIPEYVVVRENIDVRSEQSPNVLRAVRRQYADVPQSLLDGVFIDFGHAWLHVRRSNTEPVIRLTVEARDRAEAERIAHEARSHILASIGG